jgi:hypothetical protein
MTKRHQPPVPAVITANRLSDGAVVFLRPDGQWSTSYAEAEIAGTVPRSEALLALADASARRQEVVGHYVFAVDEAGVPRALRERIRADGPTVKAA